VTVTENKASVRSYFEQFLNHGDMSAANTIFVHDVRFHFPLGDLSDVAAVKSWIAEGRTVFPDMRFTVEDLFGEGELVAARWSMVGTQNGTFRGKPATGKRVIVPGNTVFRLMDGKIREMWVAFNPAHFL
jgi:steroid delta-isomerase-like uncharacterized protein